MFLFVDFFRPLVTFLGFWDSIWWIWLPVLLFLIARETWLLYRNKKWLSSIEFVVLELKFPLEVAKSPKAMEQIFFNLHGVNTGPGNRYEKYWDGEIVLHLSFEIVSDGGIIRFFIRTLRRFQKIIEANFHAQYPDAEITEVVDYVDEYPKTLPEMYGQGYRVWGTELVLDKEDAFPIRTYVEFESMEEEQYLDPVSAILELFGKCKLNERVWMQILARGTGSDWVKKGRKLVEKLREETKIKTPAPSAEGTGYEYFAPTPGQLDVIKAVERNISKPGFDTLIRVFYFAPEKVYSTEIPWQGLAGIFKGFAMTQMNTFRHNYTTWTTIHWSYPPYIFPERRKEARRARLLRYYRERKMPLPSIFSQLEELGVFRMGGSQTFVLNTEELATIFHPPTKVVMTTPRMEKMESRRVAPPVGLDIFKEEK